MGYKEGGRGGQNNRFSTPAATKEVPVPQAIYRKAVQPALLNRPVGISFFRGGCPRSPGSTGYQAYILVTGIRLGSTGYSFLGVRDTGMTETGRKYRFSWILLGDIKAGRPNLGPATRVEVYRLMQYTMRDILEQEFGTEKADEIFYKAGLLAGKEFYKNALGTPKDLNDFVSRLQQLLREMSIGILRIEKADPEKGSFVMTVSEDLDCSGLPETGYGICTYDEGFIAGLMESFTGELFDVREIDCWCTGDRTCRFAVDRRLR